MKPAAPVTNVVMLNYSQAHSGEKDNDQADNCLRSNLPIGSSKNVRCLSAGM
jgi:hypothetical protein